MVNKRRATDTDSPHGNNHDPAFLKPMEKAKDFNTSLKKLAAYLKDYSTQVVVIVLFVLASTIFAVVSPKMLGDITNQVTDDYVAIKVYDGVHDNLPKGITIPDGLTLKQLLEQLEKQARMTGQTSHLGDVKQLNSLSQSQRDKLMGLDISQRPPIHFDVISRIALWLIVFYVLSSLFTYIESWVVTSITQKTSYRLRRDISHKINRMPLSYFDKNSFGDVMSRITNDVDMVSQNLSQIISQIVYCVATILGITVMMLSISVTMTAIVVVILLLCGLTVGQIVKRSQRYFKKQQDILGRLNGHIEEVYSGHNVVKIFGSEKRVTAKFSYYNKGIYQSTWKAQFISGLIFPILTFIGNLGYVAAAMLGGWLVINGHIRIGDVQAFIQYLGQFNQPIMQVANIANIIQSTVAAAERVFEFLECPDEKTTWQGKGKIINQPTGQVSFDQIKFGYDRDKSIINNFSAQVEPGQKIAIVGPTGAGKTTMINLLMRFYDPDSGIIKLDNIDTKLISRANVRRNFGMVLQDTWLFNGTVKENLLYGKPDAGEEELYTAARAARADHVIRALPQGYDTILDENANNVSAGEKQLLTIARAMLADAPILILDEATSNVDTRTETLIQEAMDKLMAGRTSFVIAHRLSTIRNADLILVLNHGDIIESGNHNQLMNQRGFYADLYNSQFAN